MISNRMMELIEKLEQTQCLTVEEYEELLANRTPETAEELRKRALSVKQRIYGDTVFYRGIVEFSNYCKNDCLYCGLRRSNGAAERYRLSKAEIMHSCAVGYRVGMRTFVLQSGEDGQSTDAVLEDLVQSIKAEYPDCAVTLSIGEREKESYRRLFAAGADRYLLRHETANAVHYGKLHPAEMSFQHRMDCLQDLRDVGFAVGAGMMVGSPYQTLRNLAEDLYFLQSFRPEMCGIGPFIPHRDTPFRDQPQGSLELTLYLLSIVRLLEPEILLPATTALGVMDPIGREKGMLAGANVIMPNLTPGDVRQKYELYDNKRTMDELAEKDLVELNARLETVGARLVVDRGDIRRG